MNLLDTRAWWSLATPEAAAWGLLLLLSVVLLWLLWRRHRPLSQRLTPIIEAVPNAIVVVEHNGKISALNTHTEHWFGYTRAELIGQPIEILVPARYHSQHLNDRNGFLAKASHRAMGIGRELFAQRKDGSEFPVEIGLSPLVSGNRLQVLASIVDLTERKKNEERFRLVVEAAPNAMVMVNDEGRIVLVNSRTEDWFGYSRSELLGQLTEILVPERFRQPHLDFRRHYMQDVQTRSMGAGRELFGLRKDGSEFPIEIGLNPIQTADGMLVLSSIIDISERKQLETRFREHAQQVAQASRYKSEFLANMSHELRTPLNSILILSEQLRDNASHNLLPKQVEYADIVHKSGEDLLALINDILDLSRIEAGQMQVHLEKVIIAEFSDYLLHAFEPIAENRQLELRCQIADDVPAVVVVDFQRVYQIIKNLLSNAIKFTPAGGKILVQFQGTLLASKPGLMITVTDTGSGIPKDKQEHIFLAFQQLDGSTSRKFGGTGLGLAISRQLAELLGGSLQVDSQLGLGSSFSLRVPLREGLDSQEPAAPAEASPARSLAQPQGKPQHRVAIIEDDLNFSRVVADCGHEHDFSCQVYQNGTDALAAIILEPPDAVRIDLLRPDMTGWQLIEQLKPLHLPILIISCLDQATSSTIAKPWNYLVKPVDSQQLGRALELLHTEIERDTATESGTVRNGRMILLVDDDIRNVYAMSGLLEEAGMQVCVARNGAEALEVVRQRQDIDLILMDMMMPVLDGYQATANLRHELKFDKPILAVTALAMKGDREKCLAAGADDYLAKPVHKQELLALIDRLLA
jgi:PAS domain S-box-containing protein